MSSVYNDNHIIKIMKYTLEKDWCTYIYHSCNTSMCHAVNQWVSKVTSQGFKSQRELSKSQSLPSIYY